MRQAQRHFQAVAAMASQGKLFMQKSRRGVEKLLNCQGTNGFEKHMDRLMELTEYMVRRIKQMPDKYYLILEPEMVNCCFWYLPTRVRNMPHSAEREQILGEVGLYKRQNLTYRNLSFMENLTFLFSDLSDPEGPHDASRDPNGGLST